LAGYRRLKLSRSKWQVPVMAPAELYLAPMAQVSQGTYLTWLTRVALLGISMGKLES
jgi:hypothetical protein